MGFERGAIGYRMYHLPKKLPSDVIERFAELAAPGFGTPVEGPIFGWVTGRHHWITATSDICRLLPISGDFCRLTR